MATEQASILALQLSAAPEGPFGAAVGAACCALGQCVYAVGGLTRDSLSGRSTLSNGVSSWSSEHGWRHHRLTAGSPAPQPRAGHTCCALNESVLLFGGYDESAAKLDDVWELLTTGSVTRYELEVGVEAVLSVAAQESDLAIRQKALTKQKGAPQEVVEPLPLFDPAHFRAALEAELQLPAEAITISQPASTVDRPTRVDLKVTIEPLLAVGTRVYGVDGEALPRAVLTALRGKLLAAGVPEGMVEPPVDKEKKGKPSGAAAKAAKAAAEAEAAVVAADRPAPPGVGYALKCWVLNERQEAVPDSLSWRQCKPADGSVSVTARSGHTADVHEGTMWLFGGAAATGALASLAALDLASFQWVAVEANGKAPSARFSHSSCVLGAGEGATPLLVICGGLDGKRRLGDCCLLDLSKKAWCTVEIDAAAATAFPLHTAWHTMCACRGQAIVFGGISSEQEALNSLALLHFDPVAEDHAPPPSGKEAKGAAAKAEAAAALLAGGKYCVRIMLADTSNVSAMPPPRFSHCAAPVQPAASQPDVPAGVLIFGGATATSMLEDCWLLSVSAPQHR